jgi:HSP20 family protein
MTEANESSRTKTPNGPGQTTEVAFRQPTEPAALRDPFGRMRRFGEELDHLFEDFGLETRWHLPRLFRRARGLLRREARMTGADWSPRIDVLEREGQYVVRVDLPGLSKDDVNVDVQDGFLTIHGARNEEKKHERAGYYHAECSYGSFYRAIPLPEGALASEATADFRKGVLEVAVPTSARPEQNGRRVEIRESN